jgi:transposase
MIALPQHTRVYLALGSTDMRKEINELSILVEGTLSLDPFSGHLFVFCSRSRSTVKILYWQRNGFCLFQKRLEKERFRWPETREQVMEIGLRDLSFLLEGLDFTALHPHRDLHYSTLL